MELLLFITIGKLVPKTGKKINMEEELGKSKKITCFILIPIKKTILIKNIL